MRDELVEGISCVGDGIGWSFVRESDYQKGCEVRESYKVDG